LRRERRRSARFPRPHRSGRAEWTGESLR
jgi:hypothetical protein